VVQADHRDHVRVRDTAHQIRHASPGDVDAVADLAAGLAQSFTLSRASFDLSYLALLDARDACLLVATDGGQYLGYLLGFRHLTFYANGPVGWIEEVFVRDQHRGHGIGRALISTFEQWAADQGCTLIALATRRAAPFYLALGYEQSAIYHRKLLDGQTTS
jgi:GNAT superfamily N-acetyltransferase